MLHSLFRAGNRCLASRLGRCFEIKVRLRQLEQARDAIRRLAPRHPAVRRVYLFGSLLRPGAFNDASDIDVALECDELEAETPFARDLERALGTDVDLRPFTGAIVDAVHEEGEKVYG